MTKEVKGAFVFFLFIIVAVFALSNLKTLSIIGEEGYEPYDSLLAGGNFDQTKWIYYPQSELCKQAYKSSSYVCVKPFAGVTATKDTLSVNGFAGEPSGYDFQGTTGEYGHVIRTQNLRLTDFRTSFKITVPRYGGTCLWTNKGAVWCYSRAYAGANEATAGIELRWDDYELGHYQVFVNGNIVQEGTVKETEELYFFTRPQIAYGNNFDSANAAFVNPRIHRLFNCDLQEGELQTDACFGGPDEITTSDLPRFKRFCLESTATFNDAGVSAASKRVYYALAKGTPVVIKANQVWKFSYIASAPTIGNRTGVSSNCETKTVEDLNDIPVRDPVIQDQQLTWSSTARYDGTTPGWKYRTLDLRSGDQVFMHTESVVIKEALCPYKTTWQEFPKDVQNKECFSVRAFGRDFKKGDAVAFSGVSVTLQDLVVRYKQQPDTADKIYRYVATWQLNFNTKAVTIDVSNTPSVVRNASSLFEYPLTNTLPGTGTFVTTVISRPDIVNEPTTTTYTNIVKSQQTQKIKLTMPAEYQGKHTALVFNTLQTPFGGVSFVSSSVTYSTAATPQNTDPVVITPTNPPIVLPQSAWDRFLAWWHEVLAWIA